MIEKDNSVTKAVIYPYFSIKMTDKIILNEKLEFYGTKKLLKV